MTVHRLHNTIKLQFFFFNIIEEFGFQRTRDQRVGPH